MKRKEQGGGVDGAAHGQGQAFMTSDCCQGIASTSCGVPVRLRLRFRHGRRLDHDLSHQQVRRNQLPHVEVQDGDGARGTRPVGSDKWRDQAGALRHYAGPNDVQEEVSQGAGDHLSRDGRFAAAAGPVGEGCVRCMVKTGRTLREEEFGQQALPSSTFLHDDDGGR
ncbi:hypothetical protein ON010_g19177 [Phytophthora cinnamomi]|nr:hypothetical protein ON010_g19177 [Phytophthora cinnamomi]